MATSPSDAFPGVLGAISKLYRESGEIIYCAGTGRADLPDANGEPGLSFVDHALQAAQNARKAGYGEDVQIAALLHDIGWLLPKPKRNNNNINNNNNHKKKKKKGEATTNDKKETDAKKNDDNDDDDNDDDDNDDDGLTSGDDKVWLAKHDRIGAAYLRKLGFPERVAKLVEGHVQAKRYLCYKEKGYYDQLSAGSKFTLKHQGGTMTEKEAKDFENDEDFKAMLDIRRWDEHAKVVGLELHKPLNSIEAHHTLMQNCLRSCLWRNAVGIDSWMTPKVIEGFNTNGYIVIKSDQWLTTAQTDALDAFATKISQIPPESLRNGPFHTYETVEGGGKVLSRTEAFLDSDAEKECCQFLKASTLKRIVTKLRGGAAHTIYKEKINYKLKGGGGGYLPHQDSYFKLVRDGESKLRKERMLKDEECCVCMIAVDAMNESNGCPHIAPGTHTLGWLAIGGSETSAPLQGIKSDHASSQIELKWQPVVLDRGDVLIYGNMMPHMSKKNASQKNRRALFTIYADEKAVGPNARSMYYEWEASNRRSNGSAVVKGKANRFFTGKPVAAEQKQQAEAGRAAASAS